MRPSSDERSKFHTPEASAHHRLNVLCISPLAPYLSYKKMSTRGDTTNVSNEPRRPADMIRMDFACLRVLDRLAVNDVSD